MSNTGDLLTDIRLTNGAASPATLSEQLAQFDAEKLSAAMQLEGEKMQLKALDGGKKAAPNGRKKIGS